MSLSNLSIKQLEHAVELLKERDAIQSKLDEVTRGLHFLENDQSLAQDAENNSSLSISSRKRTKNSRGLVGLKEAILELLKTAGIKGLSVKEVAARLNGNENSIRTWIYTEGKKIAGIRKVAPGTFTYVS